MAGKIYTRLDSHYGLCEIEGLEQGREREGRRLVRLDYNIRYIYMRGENNINSLLECAEEGGETCSLCRVRALLFIVAIALKHLLQCGFLLLGGRSRGRTIFRDMGLG